MRQTDQHDLLHDDDDDDDDDVVSGEYIYRPTRQRRFTEPTDAYQALKHQDAQRAHNHKEN